MPIFCFKNDDGDVVEEIFPLHSRPQKIVREGVVFRRCYQAETKANIGGPGWPILSDTLGVHPSQVREAEKDSIDRGVPTHFTPDGRAILTDPKHRKKYAESLGYFDRNGGFSDPQPNNVT